MIFACVQRTFMTIDPQSTSNELINVEVAYALPEKQVIAKVAVAFGTTAAEAIELSGIRTLFPGIEEQPTIGIFSRKVALDYPLQAGDRVEIYRALLADPKEVRRRKAEEQKAQAKEELARLRSH
jgi:putative ubiquitin-RnfH superfamily antitoxin RatB of RatAB toxin-antitoxin module